MRLCKDSDCTGCCACMNVCKMNAIEMQENSYGAIIPVIHNDKCVECGACRKVCPAINPVNKSDNSVVYAAWSKDENIVKTSASAGIVTTLSLLTIEKGGVVFGTRYENRRLIFDYAESKDKIREFQGSKYVHAYVGDAFEKVKQFLQDGRKVLFTGTPCQIAGLRSYLNKEYHNLVTVDLICHGVAPASYLDEYLQEYEYDNVLFRGPEGLRTVAYKNGKIIFSKLKLADLFYLAYVKGMIHRENCYSCPYASTERVGDITAGDFWGINKDKLQQDASKISYVSLVLVNTKKGAEVFEDAQGVIIAEERTLEEAMANNKQLSKPCAQHMERTLFLEAYTQEGFMKSVKATSVYRQVKKQEFYYSWIAILRKVKHVILRRH